jgi:hypothetical protein
MVIIGAGGAWLRPQQRAVFASMKVRFGVATTAALLACIVAALGQCEQKEG